MNRYSSNWNTPYYSLIVTAGEFQKWNLDVKTVHKNDMQWNCLLNLEKMPQKRMKCFRVLLEHLAWIEHQFLRGISDSRKAGSLWGMMRGVAGERKSIHQSWLAKRLGLGLLSWGFKRVQGEIRSEETSTLQIGSVAFHQDNAPVHNSILVTDYLTKISIKSVPYPTYCLDIAPCDFWLFPKLRGCHYETIEEMKEAVTKVTDTLTQRSSMGSCRS